MIKNKQVLIGYKVFFSLLGFSALVAEVATLVDRGRFNPVNFFSYFTVEMNIVAVAVLLLSAIAVAWGKNGRLDMLRSAATMYILIVGVGFAVLLSGLDDVEFTALPWDNVVLHYLIPAALLVDLVVDRPKRHIAFKQGLVWLAVPLVYAAYSLIRGAAVDWYPYPFMNPDSRGYGAVVVAIAGLMALTVLLIWCVTRLSTLSSKPVRS